MTVLKEVAERTYRLDIEITGVQTNFSVYFLDEKMPAIIEPGPTSIVPYIQQAMKQLSMKELAYIIPTHIHVDHAGGMGKLAELFPQAKVLLHPEGIKHAVNPSRLVNSGKLAFGDNFELLYGSVLPVREPQIKTLADGEIIYLNSRQLQAIYAPGHAPHHIAYFDQKREVLFSGEALGLLRGNAESFPLPAASPPAFDINDYLKTIEKLGRLKPRTLLYSHGGVGKEPEQLISIVAQNTKAIGNIVLDALKKGETPQAIGILIQDYVLARSGVKVDESLLRMTVNGYSHYYKNKGLVSN